jgi:hypothetical protein
MIVTIVNESLDLTRLDDFGQRVDKSTSVTLSNRRIDGYRGIQRFSRAPCNSFAFSGREFVDRARANSESPVSLRRDRKFHPAAIVRSDSQRTRESRESLTSTKLADDYALDPERRQPRAPSVVHCLQILG